MTSYIKGKLGDIIELLYGKSLPENKRIYGKYPVIGSGGISGYHNEYLCKGPGIIIGRKGSIGTIQYIKDNYFPIDTVFYVKPKNTTMPIKYIYYLLTQLNLKLLNTDAAVPGLNREVALSQNISYLENEKEQEKIVKILSNYDNLIENNNKRIKILEEMAQKIYKEWFVDFKFPDHENATFKDSELGKIPSDWDVKCIENLIVSIESGSRPKGGINPNEKDIPSIGAENILGLGKYDYAKEKYISYEFFTKMKKGKVQDLDVLLYKDGAQLGRKTIFGEHFPHRECCINEHVFILRANKMISPYYLYFTLDTVENTEKIKQLNTNAAQPGINQEQVKGLKIIQPKKDLINSFDKIIQPIISQIFKLCVKNKSLKQTRDILLSRLISGEIDVENLEIE